MHCTRSQRAVLPSHFKHVHDDRCEPGAGERRGELPPSSGLRGCRCSSQASVRMRSPLGPAVAAATATQVSSWAT